MIDEQKSCWRRGAGILTSWRGKTQAGLILDKLYECQSSWAGARRASEIPDELGEFKATCVNAERALLVPHELEGRQTA